MTMIQEIQIENISIYDKKILSMAIDHYGRQMWTNYMNTNGEDRDYLLRYSIAQNYFYDLVTKLNAKKILNMPDSERKKPTRKLKLPVHVAVVCQEAVGRYREMSGTYESSRCDVLYTKIDQQIV